jgi:hypothetical protein
MQPTRRPHNFKKKPSMFHKLTEHSNIIAGLSRPSNRLRGQPRMVEQQSFCKKKLPLSKNHDHCTHLFAYQPLNFQENLLQSIILHMNP